MQVEGAKAPQTAARLSHASATASSADLTAGQRAWVKVPGQRTRESALDTSPPANRPAAVSPMGGEGARLEPASNAREPARNAWVAGGDDEHQGAEVPTVMRDRRRRARCV